MKSDLLKLYQRVIAALMERMTPRDSFNAQICPFEETVLPEGLIAVFRTGGDKPAVRSDHGRDVFLISPDKEHH